MLWSICRWRRFCRQLRASMEIDRVWCCLFLNPLSKNPALSGKVLHNCLSFAKKANGYNCQPTYLGVSIVKYRGTPESTYTGLCFKCIVCGIHMSSSAPSFAAAWWILNGQFFGSRACLFVTLSSIMQIDGTISINHSVTYFLQWLMNYHTCSDDIQSIHKNIYTDVQTKLTYPGSRTRKRTALLVSEYFVSVKLERLRQKW